MRRPRPRPPRPRPRRLRRRSPRHRGPTRPVATSLDRRDPKVAPVLHPEAAMAIGRTGMSTFVLVALAAVVAPAVADEIKIDSETFGGLEARSIGPAVMGGRIAALDATLIDGRLTIYVGSAGGGVWKSGNGGTTFASVFDKQAQSIGAVAIDK